jgi:PAS domain S-box-containing protein
MKETMDAGKVLIVEDEPIVAMDLNQEIQGLGYNVVGIAESADEALAAVQNELPDFALMDIRIEGSLDGIQTARTLLHWYHVPSVFLTSYSDDTTLARAARAMPYGYLTKPFKSAELKAALRMAVERSKEEARSRSDQENAKDAFNGMPEGVITINCSGAVRFMNSTAEALTGWSNSAAKEKQLHEILCWSDVQTNPVPDLKQWDAPAPQGDWPGCVLSRTGDERSYVDVNLTPLQDSDGDRRGYVLTLRDASERMRRQAVDEIENERPCFDKAPMAMLQLDADGRIVRINEALLRESGIDPSRVVGRSLTGLNLDPDPRIASELVPRLLKHIAFVAGAPARITH